MTKDNNRFGKDESAAKNKRIIGSLTLNFLVGGFQVATQYFAYKFKFQPQLGADRRTIIEPNFSHIRGMGDGIARAE